MEVAWTLVWEKWSLQPEALPLGTPPPWCLSTPLSPRRCPSRGPPWRFSGSQQRAPSRNLSLNIQSRWNWIFKIIYLNSQLATGSEVIGHLGESSWVEPPGTPVQFASIATDNSSGNCAARTSVQQKTWQHYLGSFGPLGLYHLLSDCSYFFLGIGGWRYTKVPHCSGGSDSVADSLLWNPSKLLLRALSRFMCPDRSLYGL